MRRREGAPLKPGCHTLGAGRGGPGEGLRRGAGASTPSDLADLAAGSWLRRASCQAVLTLPLDSAPSVLTCLAGLYGNSRETWGSFPGDGFVLPRAWWRVQPGEGASAAARDTPQAHLKD